jgi:2-oxoglutarate ferredoxin oxidoreductase subunit alpha
MTKKSKVNNLHNLFTKKEFDRVRRILGKKVQFLQGDIACGYGALLAGCRFFAGYPITPATETAEIMARMMPRAGGTYVQMEDEIGSIGAVIGASWAGARSMTATSGPGFSLMQENFGYAAMTEAPCVIVNVQRSGPSTGQPTEGAQGDMMQVKWGSHGDYEIIALAPSSVQECLDMSFEAFNLADQYRVPVFVMTDGEVGHMREKITMPDFKDVRYTLRKKAKGKKKDFYPFADHDGTKIPQMATFGEGYHTYATGLTHIERGYPSTDKQHDHDRLVRRLCEKIRDNVDKLTDVEKDYVGKRSDVAVVCYGVSSRPVRHAVKELRRKGKKIDILRIRTVWPFPYKEVEALARRTKRIVVPEMNLGQIVNVVEQAVKGQVPVKLVPKIGGVIHEPAEITKAIQGGW